MPLTTQEWHRRFEQQARWTHELRQHLFRQLQVRRESRILEVGCGTGAILAELRAAPLASSIEIHGLDINSRFLKLAAQNVPSAILVAGDGFRLPYTPGCFELACCHYLLLWVRKPVEILREMKRVTKKGGWVAVFAEPDYGSRIDYPEELVQLGVWQAQALREQGAEPVTGRRLAEYFHRAGLGEIESGVLGARWQAGISEREWLGEWEVLFHDLAGTVERGFLEDLQRQDYQAWENGSRVLFVPTFYAWGKA